MAIARRQHNMTLLPDGKVLATGGSGGGGFDNQNSPVYPAEMWIPRPEIGPLGCHHCVPRLSFHSAIAAGWPRGFGWRRTDGSQRGNLLSSLSIQRRSTHCHLCPFQREVRQHILCSDAGWREHRAGDMDPARIGHAFVRPESTTKPSPVRAGEWRLEYHSSGKCEPRSSGTLHVVPLEQQRGTVGRSDYPNYQLGEAF